MSSCTEYQVPLLFQPISSFFRLGFPELLTIELATYTQVGPVAVGITSQPWPMKSLVSEGGWSTDHDAGAPPPTSVPTAPCSELSLYGVEPPKPLDNVSTWVPYTLTPMIWTALVALLAWVSYTDVNVGAPRAAVLQSSPIATERTMMPFIARPPSLQEMKLVTWFSATARMQPAPIGNVLACGPPQEAAADKGLACPAYR